MQYGDNNSDTSGDCMLKFVQYGACLHLSMQNVWRLTFLDTLYKPKWSSNLTQTTHECVY